MTIRTFHLGDVLSVITLVSADRIALFNPDRPESATKAASIIASRHVS